MPVIRVLKPIMFSFPASPGQKVPTERRYLPGDHEVPEIVAEHEWIKSGADGRVETAEQARDRAKRELLRAEEMRVEAENATAAANAAVARLRAAEPGETATAEEILKELETPVNVLNERRLQGKTAMAQLVEKQNSAAAEKSKTAAAVK